jgi:hypothetical protein
MKKWDSLKIEFAPSTIKIFSTNPDELLKIANTILDEGYKYFSYVDAVGKPQLLFKIMYRSVKDHEIEIYHKPWSDSILKQNSIFNIDIAYFVINLIASDGWLPYPGNPDGTLFIKYYE